MLSPAGTGPDDIGSAAALCWRVKMTRMKSLRLRSSQTMTRSRPASSRESCAHTGVLLLRLQPGDSRLMLACSTQLHQRTMGLSYVSQHHDICDHLLHARTWGDTRLGCRLKDMVTAALVSLHEPGGSACEAILQWLEVQTSHMALSSCSSCCRRPSCMPSSCPRADRVMPRV